MYIKNGNLHFDDGNHISIDNVKFVIKNAKLIMENTKLATNYIQYIRNSTEFKLIFNIHKSSHEIQILTALSQESSSSESFITNISYNKMLYALKNCMSLIYDVMQLYRRHTDAIRLYDTIHIKFENKKSDNVANLITLNNNNTNYVYVHINDNGPIKHNNVIFALDNPGHLTTPKRIIINNNISRTYNDTVVYPDLCDLYLDVKLKYPVMYAQWNYSFISIYDNKILIDYYTPLSLLVKFINNIKLFDNMKRLYINNEYDILKYL